MSILLQLLLRVFTFTPELIETIKAKGVQWASVELEVGIDTFRLVTEDDPTKHVIHTERYHVAPEVVEAVKATKAAGHKVIANWYYQCFARFESALG